MQSLVSLDGYPPELREYLLEHRWPSVMEALLMGLIVMTPGDPWSFILHHLDRIIASNMIEIPRDFCISPSVRPLLSSHSFRYLLDRGEQLDEGLLERAYQFRGWNLCRWCFSGWVRYHVLDKAERREYKRMVVVAEEHFTTHTRHKLFHAWRGYTVVKLTTRAQACSILSSLRRALLLGRLLAAWNEDTRAVLRTRAWFNKQQQEREKEGQEWFWPEGEDEISLLERRLAVKIFSYAGVRGVCRCSQVCHSWRALTESPELWNRLDLGPLGTSLHGGSGLVHLLHKCRAILCHLSLRSCSSLSLDILTTIGQCQNLLDLNLSECQGITDEVMNVITRGCSALLYLNLSYCYVTDSIIRILAKRCVNLNYLSLAHCRHFTSKGLYSIQSGRGCRRLVYLDLSGCTQLTEEGLFYIGRGCPILNTLLLDDVTTLTEAKMGALVKHCKTLRHLSLLGGSRITDRCVRHIARENRKLRTIKIENNPILSDSSLKVLSRFCRDLTYLQLAGCNKLTDKGLMELKRLKRLVAINIADCSRISDLGVRYLMDGSSQSSLCELNLTNCFKLSDISLLRLTSACPSITHLNLSYCEHISDSGVELLPQLPHLYSLDLTGCSITDQGVASLRNNPQYRHLGLAELVDITDDGLRLMSSNLSLLETLDLSDCDHVTNQGLQSLAYRCHLLRDLSLSNCYQVTDTGIRYLSKGCAYLTNLDLSGCFITDKTLKQLRKGSPCLKSLNIVCCVNITREEVQKYQRKGVDISFNTDRPKNLQRLPRLSALPDLEMEHLIERI